MGMVAIPLTLTYSMPKPEGIPTGKSFAIATIWTEVRNSNAEFLIQLEFFGRDFEGSGTSVCAYFRVFAFDNLPDNVFIRFTNFVWNMFCLNVD